MQCHMLYKSRNSSWRVCFFVFIAKSICSLSLSLSLTQNNDTNTKTQNTHTHSLSPLVLWKLLLLLHAASLFSFWPQPTPLYTCNSLYIPICLFLFFIIIFTFVSAFAYTRIYTHWLTHKLSHGLVFFSLMPALSSLVMPF